MPKVKVSLFFSGNNIPLNDIASKIGISPTQVCKKEDWPFASVLAGIAKDTLLFSTNKKECTAISTQIDEIQMMFTPKIEIIQNLIKSYALSVNIIVMVETEIGEYPELILTIENIDFLSSIHAEIGFDLYINDSVSP
mgnify:CR=1 FL=1